MTLLAHAKVLLEYVFSLGTALETKHWQRTSPLRQAILYTKSSGAV